MKIRSGTAVANGRVNFVDSSKIPFNDEIKAFHKLTNKNKYIEMESYGQKC